MAVSLHRLLTGTLLGITLLLVAGATTAAMVQEAPLNLHSKTGILMDFASGQIFFEKNAHEALPPASVTKVLTLVIALEAVRDGKVKLTDTVTAGERAASMGGSQVWIEPGEQMTIEELLNAVAVGSANDAAVALAEHLAGSEDAFAQLMNERAKELGMKNSQFSNASGLPPATLGQPGPHVTSAYDLAVLSRHALQLPMFTELVSQWEYTMRKETIQKPVLYNYNRMLKQYPGLDGIKTGMTGEAGFCLSATAKRDGLRLIAVTMGAATAKDRTEDIRALLNYGFARYEARQMVKQGEVLGQIEVSRGEIDKIDVVAKTDLFVTLLKGAKGELQKEVKLERRLVAPLAQGSSAGYVVIKREGEEVGRMELVAVREVKRGSLLRILLRNTAKILKSFLP